MTHEQQTTAKQPWSDTVHAWLPSQPFTLDDAERVTKQLHPGLSGPALTTAAEASLAIAKDLPSYDPEVVARWLARTYGAFPWDGPYGNGLTRAAYQRAVREQADEQIAFARALNIPTGAEK